MGNDSGASLPVEQVWGLPRLLEPFNRGFRLIPGLALLAGVGYSSKIIASYIPHMDFIIVAIFLGMVIGNTIGVPAIFAPGVATSELWLKAGVICLGARLLLQQVFAMGSTALAIVVLEIIFSIAAVRFMVKRFNISDKLGSLLAIGVGICGVSAIIGCASAIDAEEKDQAYAIATILIFGAGALVVYPLVGYLLQMSSLTFGVWAGLAVDNTAEAIATGFIYSDEAGKFATLTKMCRNALMGVVILGFALYYARQGLTKDVENKGRFLWEKFPKFILGFLLFSLLSTVGFFNKGDIKLLKHAYKWFFMLCFVGVGLSTRVSDMKKTGFKPFLVGISTEALVGAFTLATVLLVYGWSG
jgi:uncharacterized integral membrane protein (TIGR00698 family)